MFEIESVSYSVVMTVFHVLMASMATVHVILTKEDPRSAVGWVGLSWFSPYIGVLLYYLFGINRIERRWKRLTIYREMELQEEKAHFFDPETYAQSTARRNNLVEMALLSKNLTNRELLLGNVITPLKNGDEAYPQMLDVIENAQNTICLSSFIFRKDNIGREFIAALIAAHNRGVKIRVIVDGIGGGYILTRAVRTLKRAGIKSKSFMHTFVPWRMSYVNMRYHKKILVADGVIGFTGGMNIGDKNLNTENNKAKIQDLHFKIEGPVVMHLSSAFAEDWLFLTGESLISKIWFPKQTRQGETVARGIASGPDENNEKLQWTMTGAIGRARRSVHIVTPYFLPDQRVVAALILAALRGVEVNLVIPEKTNHRYIDRASWAQYDQLLEVGCKIYHTPRPFDHSKLMVIDENWALVGSTNWDARSMRLNFEYNIELYDPDFVPELVALIEEKIKISKKVTLDAVHKRSFMRKITDGGLRLMQPYL